MNQPDILEWTFRNHTDEKFQYISDQTQYYLNRFGVHDKEDREDLAQEIFMKVLKILPTFKDKNWKAFVQRKVWGYLVNELKKTQKYSNNRREYEDETFDIEETKIDESSIFSFMSLCRDNEPLKYLILNTCVGLTPEEIASKVEDEDKKSVLKKINKAKELIRNEKSLMEKGLESENSQCFQFLSLMNVKGFSRDITIGLCDKEKYGLIN